ncbi:MAG: hypothetical protein WC654_02155 [Patescibacteria group bacterium]
MSSTNKIIATALVTVTVIVGVYFVFVNKSLQPIENLVKTDGISTWQTYNNDACGFSFKYPNDLILYPDAENVVGVATQESVDFDENQDGEVPLFYFIYVNCSADLKALIASNGDYFSRPPETITTLEQFFDANTNPFIKFLGSVVVDGRPAFEAAIGQDNSTYALFIEHNKIYQLDFSEIFREGKGADKDQLSLIQQQILSSFTFVE